MNVEAILHATGGQLLFGEPATRVTGVSTDTRTLQAGQLYVPLVGAHFDGHTFLRAAFEKGAAGCLVGRGANVDIEGARQRSGTPFVVQVDDTLQALGDLASWRVREMGVPVIAVTGSAGKTTTKDMMAAMLQGACVTPGNFNNLIGLPLTVLAARGDEPFFLLEMGMNARGEIQRLATIAPPAVGIITNVGEAHVGCLGSIEEVGRAKGELFEALGEGSVAVVNEDDPLVRAAYDRGCRAARRSFGAAVGATVQVTEVTTGPDGLPRATLVVQGQRLPIAPRALGRHNLWNAAAAVAGVLDWRAPAAAAQDLARYRGAAHRMQPFPWRGATLLSDCYNANPDSTVAALETVAAQPKATRRIAVLGDMLELGAHAAAAHERVGRRVAELRFDALFAVGEWAPAIVKGATTAGYPAKKTRIAADVVEHADALNTLIQPGDWVLIKGSRGLKMERLLDVLEIQEGSSFP